ncbi:MAG: MGMT family protein [Bacillota bacterium]|nr:MGMT family protein [Bacillota bacterium]MDW7683517.1 MGMT family protein [Bacillota bacterium]
MNNIFSPLFTRMAQKYSRFPVSCGVIIAEGPHEQSGFARLRENTALLETFTCVEELVKLVYTPHLPDIICVSATPTQRAGIFFSDLLAALDEENLQFILTEEKMILDSLGLSADKKEIPALLAQMGFSLRPSPRHHAARSVSVALCGYYYLNKEYEHLKHQQSIVPLVIDTHPLYTFLRQIPYGEVSTFADAAKSLGLQWNEQTIMESLHRLPAGADVPGHRVVNRDGSLSSGYPGGMRAQKERLKWELVPMLDACRVDLKKARWSRNKYRPLVNYLRHSVPEAQFLELHFHELEQIINAPLPRAAKRLGSWWRDNKSHAAIWLDAGCRIARVNLQTQTVTFSRRNADTRT